MTGVALSALLMVACWLLHRAPPLQDRTLQGLTTDRPPNSANGVRPEPGEIPHDDPALMMDLMAAMLAAGSSLEYGLTVLARSSSPPTASALRTVTTALDLGATWDVAWDIALPSDKGAIAPLGQALRFAGTSGAPSAAVVTAYAAQFRRRRNREAEKRAAALGVRLVVPLGLCSLPAFVCLGVIPVLVGLFPTFA